MKNTLCFIPARGGSKRVPRKNIKEFAGEPLVSYTIRAAQESNIFETILVSSEDEEIQQLAKSMGAEVDNRPSEVAKDATRSVEVIEEYIERTHATESYSNIVQMLPTCPFRTVEDVKNAYDLFTSHDERASVIGVTKYEFSPWHALTFEEDGETLNMENPDAYETTRSQDIPDAYHANGSIYLMSIDRFMQEGEFFLEPIVGYPMPGERSLDIDLPHEFKLAEIFMEEKKKEGEYLYV